MAYTVRSILGKIRLHRSDLREAELDYITQETVRKICRLTMLAQKMVVLPFVGPTAQLALTDSAGEDVNRVHLVRIQESTINTPSAPSFTSVTSGGTLSAGTYIYKVVAVGPQGWISLPSASSNSIVVTLNSVNTITLPAAPTTRYGFDHFTLYRSTNGGSTWSVASPFYAASASVVDNGSLTFVLSALPTYATGDYKTMSETNEVFMNDTLPKPDSSFGDPMVWAFDALTSTINLYPPASNAYANGGNLEVTYSYIPRGEIDTVPLPPEAEDGIIYGTLAEAYIFTGPSQNIQLGKMYETKFNNETSNLKSVAIQGNSGRMAIPANPLGGRRKKPFGAFGSSSGWGW